MAITDETPFELTVYYDCDHVFLRPPPDNLWEIIDTYGLVAPCDNEHHRQEQHILAGIRRNAGIELDRYRIIGGRCVGSRRNCPAALEWKRLIDIYSNGDSPRLFFLAEQFALGTIINMGGGKAISPRHSYNVHRKFPNPSHIPDDIVALHFLCGAYAISQLWIEAFERVREENFMALGTRFEAYIRMNSHLQKAFNPTDATNKWKI